MFFSLLKTITLHQYATSPYDNGLLGSHNYVQTHREVVFIRKPNYVHVTPSHIVLLKEILILLLLATLDSFELELFIENINRHFNHFNLRFSHIKACSNFRNKPAWTIQPRFHNYKFFRTQAHPMKSVLGLTLVRLSHN